MILFSIAKNSFSQLTYQSWTTVGGNSNRSGYMPSFFDVGNGFDRSFNAPYSLWGMPIFSFGNKFATTRYTSISPLKALVAAYGFISVNPIWTYGENSGVNIIMGMNDNNVYVRDFQQNGSDTIFALNAETGSLVWKSRFTVERGIIWTAVFTDNGDLILPGSGTKRIMRINHLNGDTVWTNNRIIPNTGAESMCINGNTLYAWEGGITTPKKIIAININTGIIKYTSYALAGDGDQEIPFTVSKNGVVYCIRDGGPMYALKDNGSEFTELWNRSVQHPVGTYTQIGIGKDSSVYIPFGRKIYRLNHLNGNALDSSIEIASSGTINPRFGIGKFGNVYVSNGADNPLEGKFYIFSSNLQTIHNEIPFSYNYYCGPALCGAIYSPHFLFTGAGTEIKAKYIIIDNIKSASTESADGFKLLQNYPNPFNPSTKLEFEISNLGFVSLKVYDMLGIEVASLVNETKSAGSYEVEFNGSSFPSGIYFYKLTIDNASIT
ncbi:MAG: PQQ-binding-like beta-propeller repeat protein, partial [Ignavibacteria bacterium]|nr:PQQ-binding-like beta-propeller repeat protein [Ignavibacteria bacterium]